MYNNLLQHSYFTRNVSHLSGIITPGNRKSNIDWQPVTVCISLVLNNLIKNRLIEKFNDLKAVLLKGQASRPYSKIGRHFIPMLLLQQCCFCLLTNKRKCSVLCQPQTLTLTGDRHPEGKSVLSQTLGYTPHSLVALQVSFRHSSRLIYRDIQLFGWGNRGNRNKPSEASLIRTTLYSYSNCSDCILYPCTGRRVGSSFTLVRQILSLILPTPFLFPSPLSNPPFP